MDQSQALPPLNPATLTQVQTQLAPSQQALANQSSLQVNSQLPSVLPSFAGATPSGDTGIAALPNFESRALGGPNELPSGLGSMAQNDFGASLLPTRHDRSERSHHQIVDHRLITHQSLAGTHSLSQHLKIVPKQAPRQAMELGSNACLGGAGHLGQNFEIGPSDRCMPGSGLQSDVPNQKTEAVSSPFGHNSAFQGHAAIGADQAALLGGLSTQNLNLAPTLTLAGSQPQDLRDASSLKSGRNQDERPSKTTLLKLPRSDRIIDIYNMNDSGTAPPLESEDLQILERPEVISGSEAPARQASNLYMTSQTQIQAPYNPQPAFAQEPPLPPALHNASLQTLHPTFQCPQVNQIVEVNNTIASGQPVFSSVPNYLPGSVAGAYVTDPGVNSFVQQAMVPELASSRFASVPEQQFPGAMNDNNNLLLPKSAPAPQLPSVSDLEVFYLELMNPTLSAKALKLGQTVSCLLGLGPAGLQDKLINIVLSLIQKMKAASKPITLEGVAGSLSAEEIEVFVAFGQHCRAKPAPEISDDMKIQIENRLKSNLISGELDLNEQIDLFSSALGYSKAAIQQIIQDLLKRPNLEQEIKEFSEKQKLSKMPPPAEVSQVLAHQPATLKDLLAHDDKTKEQKKKARDPNSLSELVKSTPTKRQSSEDMKNQIVRDLTQRANPSFQPKDPKSRTSERQVISPPGYEEQIQGQGQQEKKGQRTDGLHPLDPQQVLQSQQYQIETLPAGGNPTVEMAVLESQPTYAVQMIGNDPYGVQSGPVMVTSDGGYIIQAPVQSLHLVPEVQFSDPMPVQVNPVYSVPMQSVFYSQPHNLEQTALQTMPVNLPEMSANQEGFYQQPMGVSQVATVQQVYLQKGFYQ